ncbi:uncharacterized protein CG31750-like [Drosophila grimshawi]|uniref:uncharacterized protein CG31750-like n=1 Tax=Drosophila grimshawi TaxID=7222 RepID=UPI000C86F6FE|nr:uncharacterized protein CG31750-like [Drosophila grimshawi]
MEMEKFLFNIIYILSRTIYWICRFCVFGYFSFNEKSGKLYICQHSVLRKIVASIVKIFLVFTDNANYVYLVMTAYMALFERLREKMSGYNFYVPISIFSHANLHYYKMVYILHSRKISASYVSVINEVIEIHRIMISTFDSIYFTVEINILIIFLLESILNVLQIWNQLSTTIIWITIYQQLLFELFYWAYFVYQLILISWHKVLLRCLKSSLHNLENGHRHQQQIILFYGLYFRIWKLHSRVTKLWLKIAGALFGSTLALSYSICEELFNIIYTQSQPTEKWHFYLRFQIGHCLAPPMRIFLLGLCNNRIEELTILLSQQIILIHLLQGQKSLNQVQSVQEILSEQLLECKFNCFVLQQIRPIRNYIWYVGQTINNEFLLLYLWTSFLNAMSNLQYDLANAND